MFLLPARGEEIARGQRIVRAKKSLAGDGSHEQRNCPQAMDREGERAAPDSRFSLFFSSSSPSSSFSLPRLIPSKIDADGRNRPLLPEKMGLSLKSYWQEI
ncbi:hypothetical protein BHM03_00055650 [Ensete ventricosum]|nr:hypothetical protein BHM03_00055650 [Ensete ventricosum]